MEKEINQIVEKKVAEFCVTDLGDISALQEFGESVVCNDGLRFSEVEKCAGRLKEGVSKAALRGIVTRIFIDYNIFSVGYKCDFDVLMDGVYSTLDRMLEWNREVNSHPFPEACRDSHTYCKEPYEGFFRPHEGTCSEETKRNCEWNKWYKRFYKNCQES